MVYDLIIIGGGPAGYHAAQRAGDAGLTSLLIEKNHIGGVCLNEGCIPTKTMLYSAKIFDNALHGEKYGVICSDIKLDHAAVIGRKDKVVRTLVAGVLSSLKKSHVEIIQETAEIKGKNSEGYQIKAGNEIYSGKRLLIATGSKPVFPKIPGIKEGMDKGNILTSREILDIKKVPKSLTIIGGGIIGLEMASYFNSAGSKVTVIELLDHIAGETDLEISKILMNNYQKKGIEFHLKSMVTEINGVTVVYEKDGEKRETVGEKILVSVGRSPVTEGLGLDKIGVETERGRVMTDLHGHTNIPEVFAAGDVNGVSMLAHTAFREADVCINSMLGIKDEMRYNAIPTVIYASPEVASVGETEESALGKGVEFDTVKLSMRFSGRYVAENEGGDGICKLLIDKKHGMVIGVHLIGNYSSEIISSAVMMTELELRVREIKDMIFPHPTVSEILKEAIIQLL